MVAPLVQTAAQTWVELLGWIGFLARQGWSERVEIPGWVRFQHQEFQHQEAQAELSYQSVGWQRA